MLRNISLGIYIPGTSILHRLQARTKLFAILWFSVASVVAHQRTWHFATYGVIVGLVCTGVALCGISPRFLWRQIRLLALIIVIGVLQVLFVASAPAILTRGPLVLTYEDVWLLVSISAVLLVIYVLALLFTMTTTPIALIEGMTRLLHPLRRLRFPVDDLALMALIALRFVPTLIDEVDQLVKAQTARGADFRHGSLRDRIQSFMTLFVPLIQRVSQRAADLALAKVAGMPT